MQSSSAFAEAFNEVREVLIESPGSVKVGGRDVFQVVGLLLHERKRTITSEGNWLTAAEYTRPNPPMLLNTITSTRVKFICFYIASFGVW